MRSAGLAAFGDVEAVILETDGSFSVVKRGGSGSSSLDGVRGPNRVEKHRNGRCRGEGINAGGSGTGEESNR